MLRHGLRHGPVQRVVRMGHRLREEANQGGVGRVGSMPRTTRVAKTLAPTRPRMGAESWIRTGNASFVTSVTST